MKLDAMEKLFSIQEKIFAENGLNAALEANFHRNQIKSVKFSSQNSSTTADHNLQNSENRIPSMASTATTDFETFKSVNLEIFPYVKLLTLWRNNCFTNIMKKLQTEKVTHVPKHYAKYFPDIFFCLFSHIPAPYLPFFCLPLFPIPFPSPYLLTFYLFFCCTSISVPLYLPISSFFFSSAFFFFAQPFLHSIISGSLILLSFQYIVMIVSIFMFQYIQSTLSQLKESRSRVRVLSAQHSAEIIGWKVIKPEEIPGRIHEVLQFFGRFGRFTDIQYSQT